MVTVGMLPLTAAAEIPSAASNTALSDDRASIARQFLSRIAKKFEEADRQQEYKRDPIAAQIANYPDGENLLLQIKLKNNYEVEAPVLAQIQNKELMISLRDFLLALEFRIDVNMETGTAKGWYRKGERQFTLDTQKRLVETAEGQFPFSQSIDVEDNDIFVPYKELGTWFGIDIKPNVAALEISINSPEALPIEEKLAQSDVTKNVFSESVMPRLKEEVPARAAPLIDVSTTTSYTKPGERNIDTEEDKLRADAFVRTSGDIAGGTLNTLSSFDANDVENKYLTNFRGTFFEQSLEPDLLGPLKARRYELGDINAPNIPLKIRNNYGVGARVSNIPANRVTTLAATEIRGNTFPNWDVELYRGNQLVGVQTVGDDGVYSFQDVDLFGSNNNFRVVLYGPQGERREEEVLIPVDTKRLSRSESVYDLAVMSQDKQLYRREDIRNRDAGETAATGIVEVPIGEFSAATAGFEVGSSNEEQVYAGHAGISTLVNGTLINLDTAIDQDNEMAAQLVARRDFGEHKVRNDLKANTKNYGIPTDSNRDRRVLSNRLSVNGPLPAGIGDRPRYNMDLGIGMDSGDNLTQDYRIGYNDSLFKRLTFNQTFVYGNTDEDGLRNNVGDQLSSQTALSGSYGPNRLRLSANYMFKPDSELSVAAANYTRDINDALDFSLEASYRPNPELTTILAQLDWRAGFADISPSISYNSDKEMVATLNTRFGLLKDPLSNRIKSFEDSVTANGGISVFVFFDKNGDNIFNGDDEPIRDAVVRAAQNGGEEITDEKGYAFFTRVLNMRPTDIYVEEETLGDPYWISAYEGFSVVPREGHVVTIEFPVHVGGEIDGNVYLRTAENQNQNLRGISLSLYDLKGKKVKSTTSESDGFYLLDKVPPGRYYLTVDNKSFDGDYARPKPQPVLIKTNGSTIYGNNIYLREGSPDVPVSFYADAADLKIDPSTLHGRSLFLNLGSYKSQLTLGLAWFKIRSIFQRELKDMEILEMPSASLPDEKSNNYVLRVLALSDDMSEAYNKCKVLQANGQTCSVEVIPEQAPERLAVQ